MTTTYQHRNENLHQLAQKLKSENFTSRFVPAYIHDTAFTHKAVFGREIEVPSKLLTLDRSEENLLKDRFPLGKIAVLIPKNSIGLTLAKAIASSYQMGNETIVYFPSSLKETAPIYGDLLAETLDHMTIVNGGISSAAFMRQCLKDPEVKAIVIYGDDSWIDVYRPLAEETGTKIIFEGPGNDPMIVFPDANMNSAALGAIEGGLNNGGQSCSALERYFVHESCYASFAEELTRLLKTLKIGSPTDAQTDIGPVGSKVIFSRMNKQIAESLEMGAVSIYGGNTYTESSTDLPLLEPTVLLQCDITMPIVKDETFGPVFPLIPFSSEEDLLNKLDQTKYGLNASSYGSTPERIREYLERTHRNVYYNSNAASACNLPSRLMDGGFKRSGLIWDFSAEETERTGRRILTLELSKPR